jgi:type II secretory pathway pseudopilin PulG
MTIVLAVISLLVGSILVPLATQVEERQSSDAQATLEEMRDALIGFAVVNGYLPCPDTGTNGSENVNGGTGYCNTITGDNVACGRLPHSNLGVANADVWGNRVTYCVNERFARRTPAASFSLSTAGTDVRICTTQACTTVVNSTAVFALVSHGRNGYGAINLGTGSQNALASSTDEQENYDNNDRNIVYRTRSAAGATAGEFDDIVVWVSRYTVLNRMVVAGKLP